MEHLNIGTFLISLRFGIVGALFLIELFMLHGTFTFKDLVGLAIGIIALLVLVETKKDNKKQSLLAGFIAVGICIVTITVSHTLRKNIAINNYDVFVYLFFIYLFSLSISTVMNYKQMKSGVIFKNVKGIIPYSLLQASASFGSAITGFISLSYGANLAIYAKISSYSIFVSIILAIIIYKEKVTIKKLIAFGLTIVSLGLFL
jgi:hypothetical protein